MGRRERKKAATRRALADSALRFFLERGFDEVGVREIADAADVSTATLFKYFPTKESLLFDEDADQEAALVAAVRDREPGQSVPAALRSYTLRARVARYADPQAAEMMALVRATPALGEYAHRMWTRHEAALTRAIADETGLDADDPSCAALAHLALEAPASGHGSPQWIQAVERAFDILELGWAALSPGQAAAR
jgi:AcrR family transcriptional regulator